MPNNRKLVLILLTGWCLLVAPTGWAQDASLIDTFMVLDTVAMPGEVLPLQLYVANDSIELAAIAAYFKIDNSVLEWVGEWDSVYIPPTYLIKYDTLPRAEIPDLFYPFNLFMNSNFHSSGIEFGGMNAAGYVAAIPQGSGPIYQFYVKVKESAPVGVQTQIAPFNPIDLPPYDDWRSCQYANLAGTLTVDPTLVAGTLEVIALTYGDCNRDGLTNIDDGLFLINYIFGGGTAPNPTALGDNNCDGIVNISDVVFLIEFIFAGGPPPGDC